MSRWTVAVSLFAVGEKGYACNGLRLSWLARKSSNSIVKVPRNFSLCYFDFRKMRRRRQTIRRFKSVDSIFVTLWSRPTFHKIKTFFYIFSFKKKYNLSHTKLQMAQAEDIKKKPERGTEQSTLLSSHREPSPTKKTKKMLHKREKNALSTS